MDEINETGAKTYTQEEVDALLQQEADRRVTEALKKAERKKQIEIKEAEKLARMNEAEKFQYELEQREKIIAEREKAITLMENKQAASAILAERKLPISMVDFLVTDDAEQTKANIDAFEKTYKASLKAEVESRLSSSSGTPKTTEATGITKESLQRMKLNEMQQLYKDNPELLKQFYN